MRAVVELFVIIDGGASPKVQFKSLFESGCAERDYAVAEYPVDGSGDVNLYYKITKN